MTNLSQLTTEQFEALRKQAYEAGTKGELPPEELLAAAPHTPHIDPLLLLGNQRPSETPGYSDHYTSGPKLGETNYFPSSISEKESDIIELYRQRPNIIENRERPTRPVLPNWEALVDFENPVFRQAEAQSTDRVRLLDLRNHFATGLMDLLSETNIPLDQYTTLESDKGILGYVTGRNGEELIVPPTPLNIATTELREGEHRDLRKLINKTTDSLVGYNIGFITHVLIEYGVTLRTDQVPINDKAYQAFQRGLLGEPRTQQSNEPSNRSTRSLLDEYSFGTQRAYQAGIQLWLASQGITNIKPAILAANSNRLQGFKDALEGNDERYGGTRGTDIETSEGNYDHGYLIGKKHIQTVAPDQGPHSGTQQLVLDVISQPRPTYRPKK